MCNQCWRKDDHGGSTSPPKVTNVHPSNGDWYGHHLGKIDGESLGKWSYCSLFQRVSSLIGNHICLSTDRCVVITLGGWNAAWWLVDYTRISYCLRLVRYCSGSPLANIPKGWQSAGESWKDRLPGLPKELQCSIYGCCATKGSSFRVWFFSLHGPDIGLIRYIVDISSSVMQVGLQTHVTLCLPCGYWA